MRKLVVFLVRVALPLAIPIMAMIGASTHHGRMLFESAPAQMHFHVGD